MSALAGTVIGNSGYGNVISTMTDENKGSIGNRIDASLDHAKNNATEYLKATGVYGTLAGTAAVAIKKPNIFTSIGKTFAAGLNKIGGLNVVKKMSGTAANAITKAAEFIGKNPKATVVTTIVAAGVAALSHITSQHNYNAGKIDQKYDDRAKTQKD